MFGCVTTKKRTSEVSFTELQSLQALRHLESLALQSFELRCVAAPLRCAESLALLEGQGSLVSSGTKDSMFLAVPYTSLCPAFIRLVWLKDTFADFATLVC